jgi:hypothetical protein
VLSTTLDPRANRLRGHSSCSLWSALCELCVAQSLLTVLLGFRISIFHFRFSMFELLRPNSTHSLIPFPGPTSFDSLFSNFDFPCLKRKDLRPPPPVRQKRTRQTNHKQSQNGTHQDHHNQGLNLHSLYFRAAQPPIPILSFQSLTATNGKRVSHRSDTRCLSSTLSGAFQFAPNAPIPPTSCSGGSTRPPSSPRSATLRHSSSR